MSFSHLSVISHKNISQLCEVPSSLPARSHLTGAGSQSPSLRPNKASLTLYSDTPVLGARMLVEGVGKAPDGGSAEVRDGDIY